MKEKRPYPQALSVAQALLAKLAPACERIELAGSIRRQSEFCSDIEIVAVPRLDYNLLGEPVPSTHVDALLASWPVTLTKNGQKYKQFSFATSNGNVYQVDLFLQPDPATWGINYLIRTGSSDFSHRMVTPKRLGGLMPDDLRVQDARVWRGAELLETPEETHVFALWGMDYIDPPARV